MSEDLSSALRRPLGAALVALTLALAACGGGGGGTSSSDPVTPPTCTDGVKDGAETGVDCGGADCVAQGRTCADGVACGTASD